MQNGRRLFYQLALIALLQLSFESQLRSLSRAARVVAAHRISAPASASSDGDRGVNESDVRVALTLLSRMRD